MRNYARYNESGRLTEIGIGYGGTEITEEEYNRLLTEISEKSALVDSLYNGEITAEDVPMEWREEIQRRVDERISEQDTIEEQDISTDEFMEMLNEVM